MAFNKNNYDEYKLTPKQEKFVELIMEGKSQYEAYIEAYPKAKKWQRNTVDSRASVLVKNKKIAKRLEEYNEIRKKKIEWTRDRALNEINYVLDINKKDIERMVYAYEEDLQRKELELQKWVQLLTVENIDTNRVQSHINQILDDMSDIRKKRRVSGINTAGILNAAKLLNRMYGFDTTKVEVNPENEERKNMEKLSVEELKAIAYANINGSDAENS